MIQNMRKLKLKSLKIKLKNISGKYARKPKGYSKNVRFVFVQNYFIYSDVICHESLEII
eukprot:UN02269